MHPAPLVAAIVVSDIIERLSPNIAPPITAAIATAEEISAFSAIPIAIGPIAAIVPIDVPIAVAIKADIAKIPANINCKGQRLNPRLTVASTPPMALAVPANAPDKRKIKLINVTPGSPAFLAKISTL